MSNWSKIAQLRSKLNRNIFFFILAELFLFSINAAFFLIANIFMAKTGYNDTEIARFIATQFVSQLVFALPFGIFIGHRPLRPLFVCSLLLLILDSFLLTNAIQNHWDGFIYLGMVLLGVSVNMTRISSIPFILRNAPKIQHTLAISLSFATWSAGIVIAGFIINTLKWVNPDYFSEKEILEVIALFGLFGFLFIYKMGSKEEVPVAHRSSFSWREYEWGAILRASVPVIIIAIGAGLTIPFINLFFYNVFEVDSDRFAFWGMCSAVLVVMGSFLIPTIKRKFGYESVNVSQLFSVLMLLILATTDFYHHISWVVWVALLAFLVRQPLMNLANPMISEMTMYYVGDKSREIMSAIVSSIWSGSWVFSAIIFGYLRTSGLRYGTIFYITAFLYLIGILAYFFLIRDYRAKTKQGILTE